jgi:hypothetical protein
MAEEKVYTPETTTDQPFPEKNDEVQNVGSDGSSTIVGPKTIKDQPFQRKLVAQETISSSLNTKSKKILGAFEFTESGAIQIGTYENGVSGDLRLTPGGMTARNTSGNTTFAIDGETGDATFAGEIKSGSLVTGQVVVGNNTWIIDGDPNHPQIVLYNNGIPEIVLGEV